MYADVPDAGAIQFRSVSVPDPAYCGINRRLAEAIGAFHAFLAPAACFGWMPFIGHNTLLRTDAIRQVGGLTPGFFSDDLDLTVRLNLAGYRIAYAPEIAIGEKHPPSYTAFRKRSYKWAYGCVQTLRAHWKSVLRFRQFSLTEKLAFFQFSGFYCLQCLLLGVPLGVLGHFIPDFIAGLVVGVVLVGLVYAPLLSFYIKRRAHLKARLDDNAGAMRLGLRRHRLFRAARRVRCLHAPATRLGADQRRRGHGWTARCFSKADSVWCCCRFPFSTCRS
jgi:cellulose synthase/poly-beta-1,6-N-acetylglucosamine synthase-like glycosyltransferase